MAKRHDKKSRIDWMSTPSKKAGPNQAMIAVDLGLPSPVPGQTVHRDAADDQTERHESDPNPAYRRADPMELESTFNWQEETQQRSELMAQE
jgi:hypothetical protein